MSYIQFFISRGAEGPGREILRGAEGPGREILQRPPSVRHVSHCNSKTHWCIFSKLCRYVQVLAPCHGGVLYSFWYWWNLILMKYCFKKRKINISCFLRVLCYFQHWKKFRGKGSNFFALTRKKQLMYISFSFHFTLYVIFNIKSLFFWNIEKFPFTYWLNGRWFLQIVVRDSVNLYPIILYPLFPCSDFFISSVGGGG